MALDNLAVHARRISRWSAIALGASIPVSTALDNILLVITLAAWAISHPPRDAIKISLKNKYLPYPLLLFAALAMGTLYGAAPWREALSTLGKYADLLCIPVLAIVLRNHADRIAALHAFALSIALVVALSYLLYWNLLPSMPFITGNAASPTVFKQKITHNILVACGAFVFMGLGYAAHNTRLRVLWFSLAGLAALSVVLLVPGATGYLTLGALVVLLGWERSRWRGALYGGLGLVAFFTALIVIPSPFRDRVALIQQETQSWRADEVAPISSSSGLRLEFYHNTLEIIAAQPFTGVGTGGFSRAYAEQIAGSGKTTAHNPHNEFLHTTAQIGVIGLWLLIAMFWKQWQCARTLDGKMEQALARGLVLTMVSGSLVNSLLLDHAEGLFYAWLSGLLWGGASSLKYALRDNLPAQR